MDELDSKLRNLEELEAARAKEAWEKHVVTTPSFSRRFCVFWQKNILPTDVSSTECLNWTSRPIDRCRAEWMVQTKRRPNVCRPNVFRPNDVVFMQYKGPLYRDPNVSIGQSVLCPMGHSVYQGMLAIGEGSMCLTSSLG